MAKKPSKKEIIINTLTVDGKVMKTWTGKRIPKDIKRLSILKGIVLDRQVLSEQGGKPSEL